MIEVHHVRKTYGKGKNAFTALNNITFTIPDGASVAIIGKSGSGKSTLMHAVSGLDRPEEGEIIINGDDILKFKKKDMDKFRSSEMSFIFQSFFVQGNETCYDNVSLPLEIARISGAERKEKIMRALTAVGLEEKAKVKAKNLSGGQKQRLAIARAIANDPKILFADEPTGNLDSSTGADVERLLFGYNKKQGTTLIIVTHDEDLAKKCDMQIAIRDGEVINTTTKKENTRA